MADTRITQLGEISTVTTDDYFVTVDGTTVVTKKVQAGNMLPDSVVTTAKIATGAVTGAKTTMGSCSFKGYFTSIQTASTNVWATATPNTGTSGSRSITTNGGKIYVSLEAPLWVNTGNGEIGVQINGADYEMASYSGSTGEARTFTTVITGVPAGTYTINIRMKASGGGNNNINAFHDVVLTAFEF